MTVAALQDRLEDRPKRPLCFKKCALWQERTQEVLGPCYLCAICNRLASEARYQTLEEDD